MNQKKCVLCNYWYFLNKNFSYGPYLCYGCYNMILKILLLFMLKKSVYRIYFQDMKKRKAKKLMASCNLIDKKGIL